MSLLIILIKAIKRTNVELLRLGATGLAQCAELCWQLRGECGPRQVANAKVGLQHNLGLGGAVVVTAYRKPQDWAGVAPKRKVSGAMGFPDQAKL